MNNPDKHDERYQVMKKVTVIGAIVNFFLAIAQVLVGVLGHSQGLIADGVHTLSDLIGDIAVILASKEANKGADEDHPYGHGRIETLATVVLGVILIVVGAVIGFNAVNKLMNVNIVQQPNTLALIAAFAAIFSKEALFHYTIRIARQTNSRMLEANAWHHRSDVFSSIIVVIGVAGSMMGYLYADIVAAFLVAMLIARMGFKMGWESIQELIDTSLDQDQVEDIKTMINSIEGVQSSHMLRTRRMGGYALADVHIQVDPRLSVSEGHQISEAVRQSLIQNVHELDDVTVHIDPEDDEEKPTCAGLPLRTPFLQRLYQSLGDLLSKEQIEEITLHYLNGKIDVDIHINDSKVAFDKIRQTVESMDCVGKVYLCLSMSSASSS